MLKKIILLLLIQITFIPFAKSYYDMSTPVEGESIANDALQFNVIEKIYTTLSPYNPTCSDFKIKNTQILSCLTSLYSIRNNALLYLVMRFFYPYICPYKVLRKRYLK